MTLPVHPTNHRLLSSSEPDIPSKSKHREDSALFDAVYSSVIASPLHTGTSKERTVGKATHHPGDTVSRAKHRPRVAVEKPDDEKLSGSGFLSALDIGVGVNVSHVQDEPPLPKTTKLNPAKVIRSDVDIEQPLAGNSLRTGAVGASEPFDKTGTFEAFRTELTTPPGHVEKESVSVRKSAWASSAWQVDTERLLPKVTEDVPRASSMDKNVHHRESALTSGGRASPATGMSISASTAPMVVTTTQIPPSSRTGGPNSLDVRNPQALSEFGRLISVKTDVQQTELHVQVIPEGMGELQVSVVKSVGGLQMQVTATQEATFQWLNAQLPALQQVLQARGVELIGLQLSMSQSNNPGSRNPSERRAPNRESGKVDPGSASPIAPASRRLGGANHGGDISVSV